MSCHHSEHTHQKNCGHIAIKHEDHVDYIHNGHLHTATGDDHKLEGDSCDCACNDHVCEVNHTSDHSKNCVEIPHDDHVDCLVGNHLHHRHEDHCDCHGNVTFA